MGHTVSEFPEASRDGDEGMSVAPRAFREGYRRMSVAHKASRDGDSQMSVARRASFTKASVFKKKGTPFGGVARRSTKPTLYENEHFLFYTVVVPEGFFRIMSDCDKPKRPWWPPFSNVSRKQPKLDPPADPRIFRFQL